MEFYVKCEFCGTIISWDNGDDLHGMLWYCEDCGRYFCEKCFTEKHGHSDYAKMVHGNGKIYCPDCFNMEV